MYDPREQDEELILGLRPGEHIRASVVKVDADGSALLGMLGHYVRVQCHRRVAIGDELTIEVHERQREDGSLEICLRCIDDAPLAPRPNRPVGGAGIDVSV